jgi:hypothetical protein
MRYVRRIALGTVLLAASLIVGIHLYAWVFRIRAEHLLAQLKTFQVEETPAADVLKLRSKYRSYIIDHRGCSEEHCDFWISLVEWESLTKPSNHNWVEQKREFLMGVLRPVGLRLTLFDTDLEIEKGKLRKLDVRFGHAYVERDRFPNFIARAMTAGNFSRWLGWQRVYEHPNLLVWEPSACTGCSGAITADFTWQASRDEFERALAFDLSCITRFHVCRTVEELLPSAARLLKEDRAKESGKMDWQLPCDKRTAAILGRDSVWVDLARVKQIKGEEGEYVVVDYESLKALKGGNIRLSNIYHRSELAHAVITDSEGPQHLSRVGSERILFMDNLLDKPDAVFQCAVMPNTPDFITATLEGIAADRSATIGQE